MSSIYTFPYITKKIAEGNLVVPQVTLEVDTPTGYKDVPFLLDSGADGTSLPIHPYLDILGVKLNLKEKTTIGGVKGRGVTAYPTKLKFKLGKTIFLLRCYFIASKVDPLLGRLDFWDRFSISFDNKKQLTVISPLV